MITIAAPKPMPNSYTASPDQLPTEPTPHDFSRLGAVVTLERYRVDSASLWAPDDVAASLLACKDLMPFPSLTKVAMRLAREPRIKTPGGIGLYMAGVIEL